MSGLAIPDDDVANRRVEGFLLFAKGHEFIFNREPCSTPPQRRQYTRCRATVIMTVTLKLSSFRPRATTWITASKDRLRS
jgi:hypothetical protein